MAAWSAVLLLAAVAGADDTVLLEFSTSNCEPCRMMEPVIRRLQNDGYAVQQINAESQPQAARQFRMKSDARNTPPKTTHNTPATDAT